MGIWGLCGYLWWSESENWGTSWAVKTVDTVFIFKWKMHLSSPQKLPKYIQIPERVYFHRTTKTDIVTVYPP